MQCEQAAIRFNASYTRCQLVGQPYVILIAEGYQRVLRACQLSTARSERRSLGLIV
jgi:hypothetical protein